ncbi:hypothetical protein [Legionella fallonii]|uniref:Uncharacterized protein n=1 Tax=Legionella fallonii LLAP-10 TaxID=1212491 RepID=A0A098GBM1_9GAMM|nr:hypothetical protein [Legionella fallonii]CEG59372.1 protein of unknown function [Legionella fallonii LLAP-10]
MTIMPINRLISELDNIQYESKYCCFSTCENKPINSHTIPENFLYKINSDLLNVMTLEPRVYWIMKNAENNTLTNVDKEKFSTFKGFCIDHDTRLFFKLDNFEGKINSEIALLVHYRNICYGIHHIHLQMLKEKHLRKQNFIGSNNLYGDIYTLIKSDRLYNRLRYCLDEHIKRKKIMEKMIKNNQFDSIDYFVMSGSLINPIFCGRSSIVLHENENIFKFPGYSYMPWVSYISLINGNTSYLPFCWLKEDKNYSKQAFQKMEHSTHREIATLLAYGASDAVALDRGLFEEQKLTINLIANKYRVY